MNDHVFDAARLRDTLMTGSPAVSGDHLPSSDASLPLPTSTSGGIPVGGSVVSGVAQSFQEMVADGTMPQGAVRDLAFGSPGQQLTAYLTARMAIGLRDVARAVLG